VRGDDEVEVLKTYIFYAPCALCHQPVNPVVSSLGVKSNAHMLVTVQCGENERKLCILLADVYEEKDKIRAL